MAELEKVIKGLECCILRDPDDKPRCKECPYEGNCINRLKADILSLLKAQEPGWISVKDRLPERSGYYLCYKPNAVVDGLKIDVHRWRSIDGDWAGSEVGSRIIGLTHWLPLPDQPKEET